MDLQESKLYDLDLGVKVTQDVAQYHPHHVTYAPVNFEVATSNGSGEYNIIILRNGPKYQKAK